MATLVHNRSIAETLCPIAGIKTERNFELGNVLPLEFLFIVLQRPQTAGLEIPPRNHLCSLQRELSFRA